MDLLEYLIQILSAVFINNFHYFPQVRAESLRTASDGKLSPVGPALVIPDTYTGEASVRYHNYPGSVFSKETSKKLY